MSHRIAVLVLACASAPYDQTIEAMRRTWGAQTAPPLDIFYVYGNPHDDAARDVLSRHTGGTAPVVADDAIAQIGDVLIAGCADHMRQQEDCLLRKRLIAFAHLAAADRYDLIYSVCAASYVDRHALVRRAAALPTRGVVHGTVSIDESRRAPFVSGASTIFSIDIARRLANDRQAIIDANQFGFRDDVTIGHWIATAMSRVPLPTVLEDIQHGRPMTADHIFMRDGAATVDYVLTPARDQRPVTDAFHYHFHSARAADMVQFHMRYFV